MKCYSYHVYCIRCKWLNGVNGHMYWVSFWVVNGHVDNWSPPNVQMLGLEIPQHKDIEIKQHSPQVYK